MFSCFLVFLFSCCCFFLSFSAFEKYWPGLFARALEGKDVKELISNIGSASGPAVAAPAAGSGSGAAEAPKVSVVSLNRTEREKIRDER